MIGDGAGSGTVRPDTGTATRTAARTVTTMALRERFTFPPFAKTVSLGEIETRAGSGAVLPRRRRPMCQDSDV
jgi:hypothetical protein